MMINDKSIPLPKFSGKEEEYQMWKAQFKGFCAAKGIWSGAIIDKAQLPTSETTVLDPSTDARQIQARDCNRLMMAYLLNAFKKTTDTQKVMNTMSDDWPSGLAHEVMDALDTKYNPKDLQTDVELETKCAAVHMKTREDPDTLFEQIDAIATWYNTTSKKMDETKKIAMVMAKASYEYKSILATEATMKGNNLKMEDLRKVMKMYYRSK
jgi:hypothetical protein